ncbi:MAG: hypothetical protein H6838_06040 [Planctomycetes bacterium]|nr:hypothetical protein [Planctomycetota bacterium]MCB9885032.1 hypothetical protein [Planctomycetota bacterium]
MTRAPTAAAFLFAAVGFAYCVTAQRDLARGHVDEAARQIASDPEAACDALLEAHLAIERIDDEPTRAPLLAAAQPLADRLGAAFAHRLDAARAAVTGSEAAIDELITGKHPSLAWAPCRDLATFAPARAEAAKARILAAREHLSSEERRKDEQLAAVLNLTLAAHHGQIDEQYTALLEPYAETRRWLGQRQHRANATMALAIECHAARWYATALRFARHADANGAVDQRGALGKVLREAEDGLARSTYERRARPCMEAFRRANVPSGKLKQWQLTGMIWSTPWRGESSQIVCKDAIAGDLLLEAEVQLTEPRSKFQVLLATPAGPGTAEDYCALELELRPGGLVVPRLVHVSPAGTRTLLESKQALQPSGFFGVRARVRGDRVEAVVAGIELAADLPATIREAPLRRYGFAVPEQDGRMKGRQRDKDDVIRIRNLIALPAK